MKMRKRYLLAGLLVAAGMAWAIRHFAAQTNFQQIQSPGFWRTVAGASHVHLLLASALIAATYYLRSIRWQVLLRPLRAISLNHVVVSTLIGFSAVALVGRPGEFIRPVLIARKEGVAISSQLGAWTLERILDSMAIVALLGASLWLWPPAIAAGSTASTLLESFRRAGEVLLALTVGVAVVLALLHHWPRPADLLFQKITQPLPEKFRARLLGMYGHFTDALAVIGDVRNLLLTLGCTALIWVLVLGSYWSVAQALGSPLDQLNWGGLTLVLVASGLGSLVHLPAVGGGIQIASILTLTHLFNVPLPTATSMALFLWIITYLLVLIPGLPLAAREGFTWRTWRTLPTPVA